MSVGLIIIYSGVCLFLFSVCLAIYYFFHPVKYTYDIENIKSESPSVDIHGTGIQSARQNEDKTEIIQESNVEIVGDRTTSGSGDDTGGWDWSDSVASNPDTGNVASQKNGNAFGGCFIIVIALLLLLTVLGLPFLQTASGQEFWKECLAYISDLFENGFNTRTLSERQLSWAVEPFYPYDDVEPIWAADFSTTEIAKVSDKNDTFANSQEELFEINSSLQKMLGNELNFPSYSCFEQYYSVSNGNHNRLFYMQDGRDSGANYNDGELFQLNSSLGIQGGSFQKIGREPWNITQNAEMDKYEIGLWWDTDSQDAYVYLLGDIFMLKPAKEVGLHKPYPVCQKHLADVPEGARKVSGINIWQVDIDATEYKGDNADKYALWSPKNGLVTDFIYDEIASCSYGIIAACKNGKWGYLDENGKEISEFIYDAVWKAYPENGDSNDMHYLAYPCTSDTMVVSNNGEIGLLYRDGQILIECGVFDDLAPAWNNLLWAKKDGLWGLIDLAKAKDKAGLDTIKTPAAYGDYENNIYFEELPFHELSVQPEMLLPSSERKMWTVNTDVELNLRAGMDTSTELLNSIPNGETVISYTEETNERVLVRYNGQYGWVSSYYLSPYAG